MKYINQWLGVKDFVSLMKDKIDRRVFLIHVIVAINEKEVKIFEQKIKGKILNNPDGNGLPSDRLIVLEGNNQTIAKNNENSIQSSDDSRLWVEVIDWRTNKR